MPTRNEKRAATSGWPTRPRSVAIHSDLNRQHRPENRATRVNNQRIKSKFPALVNERNRTSNAPREPAEPELR